MKAKKYPSYLRPSFRKDGKRGSSDDLEKITRKWLKEHKFKYHQIIFNKPRGGNYHYIDNSDISSFKFKGSFEGDGKNGLLDL